MGPEGTLLGTFSDVDGEEFEVLARGRLVWLRGSEGTEIVLGRDLDRLRELLGRAAMPGQAPDDQ